MARAVYASKLATRTARSKLPVRTEPYWQVIGAGLTIGYRRSAKKGSWIAKYRDDVGKRICEVVGAADDFLDPDGHDVLSFNQAQEKARTFQVRKARDATSEIRSDVPTVEESLAAYFSDRDRRGSKGVTGDRSVAAARIAPALGRTLISKLTTGKNSAMARRTCQCSEAGPHQKEFFVPFNV